MLELESAGARLFHFDVMDGHFVRNLTFGPLIIESLQDRIRSRLDVHLMVTNPEEQIAWFDLPPVRSITIHCEASKNLLYDLTDIRNRGKQAGIALNPPSRADLLAPFLPHADQVLVMSVYPGFGGQDFLDESLRKIEHLANWRAAEGFHYSIQVDGGIAAHNVASARSAGADEIIAGSAVFRANDPAAAYRHLTGLIAVKRTA